MFIIAKNNAPRGITMSRGQAIINTDSESKDSESKHEKQSTSHPDYLALVALAKIREDEKIVQGIVESGRKQWRKTPAKMCLHLIPLLLGISTCMLFELVFILRGKSYFQTGQVNFAEFGILFCVSAYAQSFFWDRGYMSLNQQELQELNRIQKEYKIENSRTFSIIFRNTAGNSALNVLDKVSKQKNEIEERIKHRALALEFLNHAKSSKLFSAAEPDIVLKTICEYLDVPDLGKEHFSSLSESKKTR